MNEIYMDNAATTRPWPEVADAMAQVLGSGFGNASSLHRRGLAAARAVSEAKASIERAVGSGPWSVVFTSGGSEANTQAVLGSVPRGKRNLMVTSTLEHASIEDACKRLEKLGNRLVIVNGGRAGVVDPAAFSAALDGTAALVSLTHVAGELGTVQPVQAVARRVKRIVPECRMHVDAVQAFSQLETLDYISEIDMVSVSAHKIHGPQGVGALMLRPGVTPRPLLAGGDQQEGLRPGTLNLPGIVGFGVAARLLCERRGVALARMRGLTDRLIAGITGGLQGVGPLGDPAHRAPGIVVVAVDGLRSEVLLHALEMHGLIAASGSACHSRRKAPPVCLTQAGLGDSQGAVRLSLTLDTTEAEVDRAAEAFIKAVTAVRSGRTGG